MNLLRSVVAEVEAVVAEVEAVLSLVLVVVVESFSSTALIFSSISLRIGLEDTPPRLLILRSEVVLFPAAAVVCAPARALLCLIARTG